MSTNKQTTKGQPAADKPGKYKTSKTAIACTVRDATDLIYSIGARADRGEYRAALGLVSDLETLLSTLGEQLETHL